MRRWTIYRPIKREPSRQESKVHAQGETDQPYRTEQGCDYQVWCKDTEDPKESFGDGSCSHPVPRNSREEKKDYWSVVRSFFRSSKDYTVRSKLFSDRATLAGYARVLLYSLIRFQERVYQKRM